MTRRTTLLVVLGVAAALSWPSGPVVLAAGGSSSLIVATTEAITEAPLSGACLELWTDAAGKRGTRVGLRCDGVAGPKGVTKDHDGLLDGVLAFIGVPSGRYILTETRAPGDPTGRSAPGDTSSVYAPVADQPVVLTDGAITRLIVPHTLSATLVLHKVDGAGDRVPGACFDLRSGKQGVTLCDGPTVPNVGPGDGNADGLLIMTRTGGLEKGPYTLRETRPPDGYVAAKDQTVTISATAGTELTVTNELVTDASLIVATTEAITEAPLSGACLELWTDAAGKRGTRVGLRCDGVAGPKGVTKDHDGLLDGVLAFIGVPSGRYILTETRAPGDPTGRSAPGDTSSVYAPVADQPVVLTDGAITRLIVPHTLSATLVLHKVDGAGDRVPGACFDLRSGKQGVTLCDGPTVPNVGPGDGNADGLLIMTRTGGLEKGPYTLRETRPPDGYVAAKDQTVTISATAGTELTVTNELVTDASLIVATTEAITEAPLSGACLELWTDAAGKRGTRVGLRCDGVAGPKGVTKDHDGLLDGVLAFIGVPSGRYILTETRAPGDPTGRSAPGDTSSVYAPVADQPVVLTDGAITRLIVPHTLSATLVLHKVDGAGDRVPGACFDLRSGKQGVTLCDGPTVPNVGPGDGNADGLLIMTRTGGLEKGPYTLRETRPPDGYVAAKDQTVTISATAGTELTVTNELVTDDGGTPGGTPIIALDLEIDSTITLRSMSGLPVDGVTTAKGRIRLEKDPSGDTWRGTGTLASTTSSKASGCPSMRIQGEGTYDWVVRSATVQPGGTADGIVVSIDSGPITESPDGFVADMCSDPIDGVMNTWENAFFTVHRAEFKAQGFEVSGWTAEGTEDAWTAGGPIATTVWTGDCTQPLLSDCHAGTTFRLVAVVIGTTPAPATSAPPNAAPTPSGEDASAAPSAKPTDGASPEPSGLVPAAAGVLDCADLAACFASNIGLLAAFVAATVAVVGAALLLRARGRGSIPTDVPGSRLDYDRGGIDPSLSGGPVDLASSPASGDKMPPDAGGDIK